MTPQQKQDLQAAILSYETIARAKIELISHDNFNCTPDKIVSEARRIITTCSDIIEYNSRAEELRKILEEKS